jgi:hypothetical protein
MLDRKVGIPKIIHGDDRDTLKVRTSASMGEVLKLTAKGRQATVQRVTA